MSEPIIRVAEFAWGRIRSPDLDEQEEFLTNFGMVRADRTDTALYMRGTNPDHHLHITEKGDPGFIGLGFEANSEDDLHKLAAEADGASEVHDIDEPGGGKRVLLKEANGYAIEVVWGVEKSEPIPVDRHAYNLGSVDKYARAGELWRKSSAASQVMRIGHGVMGTPKVKESIDWLQHHIGLIGTDHVHVDGNEDEIILSFNRIDAGERYVDHHVFLYVKNETAGLNHVSFEVQDFDDVVMGHEYLKNTGKYDHVWGLGRHILGSQIFDYWKDPWGRVHEHWTDTDTLNNEYGTRMVPASEGLASQWGEDAPREFIGHVSP